MRTRVAYFLSLCIAGFAGGVGATAAETPANPAAQKLILSAGKGDPALVLAQQLCTFVNQQQKRLNVACEAKESGGAVDSLHALDGEEVHIAFARADWVQQAMAGTGPFRDKGPMRGSGRQRSGGPNEELRALFSLQVEAIAVLTRADSGIKSLADLKGKRLNIGPPASGARTVYELMAPALGWQTRDFEIAAELGPADQVNALCRGRLDAIFFLAAQPDAALRNAAAACDTALVPVAGREVEALDKEKPFLLRAAIPAGLYKTVPRELPTLGIAVVAVASSKVDAKLVYEIVKLAFDNLQRLQRADPVFARLDARRMTGDGLVAPLHEGALKLYKERGLVR